MRLCLLTVLIFGLGCESKECCEDPTTDGAQAVIDSGGSMDSAVYEDQGPAADQGVALDDTPAPDDADAPDVLTAMDGRIEPDGARNTTSVERVPDCQGHAAFPEQTDCVTLRVTCGGLPPTDVKVRVWRAADGSAPQGNIVMGMGGTGTGWVVDDRANADAVQGRLLRRLAGQGFTVFERAWVDGWWGASAAGAGLAGPACRYVALVDYLKANLAQDGPTCVFGNSGGSTEISYALTHHDLESRVTLAVLGGGPPMGRVDLGCQPDDADPQWRTQCDTVWGETQTECADRPVACGYKNQIKQVFDESYGSAACSDPQGGDLARLRADSVVSDTSDYAYPNTHVHFLHGRADCTEAPILGTLYWQAITTAKSRTLAEGTPHRTISAGTGARDLTEVMTARCR